MSKEDLYTNQDAEKFAALMPNTKGNGGKVQRQNTPPEIRTRTHYTDRDLEKFQKMFSDGYAPEPELVSAPHTRFSNRTISHVNEENRYNSADAKQFKRLAHDKPSRMKTPKIAKGGRITENFSAEVYNQKDLEQFHELSKVMCELESSTGAMAKSRSNPVSNGNQRVWRFPDLHQPTTRWQTITSLRAKGLGHSTAKSKSRVRLGYFD